MNWLTEMITGMIGDWITDIVDVFFGVIETIFDSAETWVSAAQVEQGMAVTLSIANVFVGLLICKHILDTYILETNGDHDTDPLQIIVNCSISVAIINTGGLFCNLFLTYAEILTNTLIEKIAVRFDDIGEAILGLLTLASPIATVLLMVYVIMLIIFLFRAILRGAELALMKILFPIFACDYVTQSRERWNAFLMSFLIVIFGYSIQLFAFRLSVISFLQGSLENQLYGIGFLWMAITTPKWLEKFVYKSGLGQKVGHGATSAMYVLPRFIGR